MKLILTALLLVSGLAVAQKPKSKPTATEIYFPGTDLQWKKKSPSDVGMNAQKLQEAISMYLYGSFRKTV